MSKCVTVSDLLFEYDERLGDSSEPVVLTLTEKKGFIPQVERFNKRLATADTRKYKVIRRFDIAYNQYLLWAGAIAQNKNWESGIVSPAYPTFRVRDGYDPRYVDWLLAGDPIRIRYDAISFGAVPRRRRAKVDDFLSIEIPKPPNLAEQKRIAAILDAADALRAKRRESLDQLDVLLQSTFLDMFGDPTINPMGWDFVQLGEKSNRITKGQSPKWQGFSYQEDGILFVTSENVRDGNLDISNPKYVQTEFNEKLKSSELRAGDLLVNLVGASIGRSCLFAGYEGAANVNQAVGVVTLNDPLLSIYVVQLLQTKQGKSLLTGRVVEAARANISLKNLRELPIPFPPLDLQKKFATIVHSIETQKTRLRAHLAELDTLFASLQSRAFNGEL